MYRSARSLYNNIGNKYHDNRSKAPNDITELPAIFKLVGDVDKKRVLDMGCGLGKHAKEFIKRGANVVGYDASEKMVKYTKLLCKDKGTFFRSTHETVTFEPNSFEIANASYTLGYSNKLDLIFSKVNHWLVKQGIFTFSTMHPVWLLNRVEKMDYSKPSRVVFKLRAYDIELFNYYYPLEFYIQLINRYNFKLLNLIETTIPRRYRGWSEEKYRIPNALVFKLVKS